MTEELRALVEALKPFVEAFDKRRVAYSKRYRDQALGFANFDKMPDNWPMGPIDFDMGVYRRARTALTRAESLLSSVPDGGWNTLDALREANISRQRDWCPDQVPDLSFRGVELAGEAGEVCNVIKKLERERLGWRGSRDTVEHLAEELADVVICADLIGISAGGGRPLKGELAQYKKSLQDGGSK